MNVNDLVVSLEKITQTRSYIERLEIVDQSVNIIKARLFINPEIFVQIYRNDMFNTTNFALIINRQRIYGRDQLGGIWHRHQVTNPEIHDKSIMGKKGVTLEDFIDEIEEILTDMELP